MTSASAILNRAADLIRDTAEKATDGPWVERFDAPGRIAGPYGALVCELRSPMADGRWIALMSPTVADSQERILRAAAAAWARAEESYRRDRSVINPSAGELSGHWGTWGMTLEERVGETDREALALARAVLGEKEEQ